MPARKGGEFLEFPAARRKVKALGIRSSTQYKAFNKARLVRERLPSNPHIAYAAEWFGWPHFLGTGPKRAPAKPGGSFLLYAEARERVMAAGIRTSTEYAARQKWRIENNLPGTPYVTYGSQWRGWKHFLGKRKKSPDEIATICKSANVTTAEEYTARKNWRLENDLPRLPPKGMFRPPGVYEPVGYEKARRIVRDLRICTYAAYLELTLEERLKYSLPIHPTEAYAGTYRVDHFFALARKATGWQRKRGGGRQPRPLVSYERARRLMRDLGIHTDAEYKAVPLATRSAHRLPGNLHNGYGDAWRGAAHFFALARKANGWQRQPGSGRKPRPLVSYEQARRLMRDLCVHTEEEYKALPLATRSAHELPGNLYAGYGDEWRGAAHFFALARKAAGWRRARDRGTGKDMPVHKRGSRHAI